MDILLRKGALVCYHKLCKEFLYILHLESADVNILPHVLYISLPFSLPTHTYFFLNLLRICCSNDVSLPLNTQCVSYKQARSLI